ncbi:MAG TPA: GDSL-type esterase/lipase family protein [Streptosporangiaceae bacterium]|nr:GDSL-type esterase/lipase family protein [Streptosporangiaceae bacterium]
MQLDQPGVSAGTGCQIDPDVVFEVDPGAQIVLGDRVSIRRGTTIQANRGSRIHIGNDVAIGENVFISSMVAIVIGSGTGVSNLADIRDHNHVVREARFGELPLQPWASGFEGAPIVIERGVLLSNKVTVTAGACVGANAVVGANSVVTRHIRPDTVVAGAPARVIREFAGVSPGAVFRPPLHLGWVGTSIMERPRAISDALEVPWPVPEPGDQVQVTSVQTGGYVRTVADDLQTAFPHLALSSHNHAVGGATSRDLVGVCKQVAGSGQFFDVALFGCGLNDVWRGFQGKTEAAVGIEEFAGNVEECLVLLSGISREVIYVEESPFGRDLEGLPTVEMNEVLQHYMAKARGVAARTGAAFVPVTRTFLRTSSALGPGSDLWADGVHLSRLGDHLLASTVIDHVKAAGTITKLSQLRSLDRELAPAHYQSVVDEAVQVVIQ